MNVDALPPDWGANDEIATLIETLHETSQRLEELTAGEVDAVADRNGRTFLLPGAQDQLRQSDAARQAAILNALPAHVVLLDAQGIVVSVNEGWRRFADSNALQSQEYGIGLNYLDICNNTEGSEYFTAHQASEGILSVLTGRAKRFSLEYPCDSPTEQRWYLMTVTPLSDDVPSGVVVMHLNTTEEKQATIGLRRRTAFFEALVKTSADGILVVDTKGTKILQNRRFNELWKIPKEILNDPDDGPQLKFITNLTVDAKAFAEKVAYLYAHPDEASQDEVALKDGTLLDRYSAPVLDQDDHFYGRIWSFRDITERRKVERRLAYLNRVYAVLSGINALIVRVRNRNELFEGACRIAVEHGGFRMALIGMVEPGTMKIVTVGMAGKTEELELIKNVLADSDPASQTMVMRAIREKTAIVSNDSQHDPDVAHVRMHIEFGVHSMIIAPLIIANQVVCVIALYANEIEFFHEEEVKLLTELAGDIAFAIDHIEKRKSSITSPTTMH